MQKIFYNAQILTMDRNNSKAEAFLVNDENIVFIGTNEEVLQMKKDDVELVDLKQKKVMPNFFNDNLSIFRMIEELLLSRKKEKSIENNADINDEYSNFKNFEIYKKEFLKIQKSLIELGIATVKELFVNEKSFAFWKKIADEQLLKIDVIGYVDYKSSKKVMDDNCRSYRKYKNHFRLGGYVVSIDGSVVEKKAWLNKPYKHEKGYIGYSEYFDEELSFLFKTALEEKKQLLVRTNGDRAVDQFLRCFEETVTKEKVEDVYRPVAMCCGLLTKKQLQKMKDLKIVPSFDVSQFIKNADVLKSVFGKRKLDKIQPYKDAFEIDIKFLLHGNHMEIESNQNWLNFVVSRKKYSIFAKNQNLDADSVLKIMISHSAESCFDQEQKGSLESGKRANFFVFDGNLFDKSSKISIKEMYIDAEKV